MAVSYGALKCTECAGKKFDYIKEEKAWKCLYCGALNRRAEDPVVFSLKNNVRQVILDVAYRRLDSAEQNLVQCEKIDSRHVGTLIAKIAYQMIKAITPGACPQAELRALFSQLKRDYEALQAIDSKVTGDEEALYEFFDAADVYATLLLVYDSLNDSIRRDYVAGMMKAAEVYAKEPNKNLLSYALKNEQFDLIDDIMSNPDNVEPSYALAELLQKYPDNKNKTKNIETLIKTQTFKNEDKKILEGYLVDSSDSLFTKGEVVIFAYSANVKISLEVIISYLLSKADEETVDAVLCQVCSSRLNDEEAYKIVEFAITVNNPAVAVAVFNVLKETDQYLLLPSKYFISLLSRTDLSASDKGALLKKMFEFNVAAKSKDAIISNYLCFNKDAEEIRVEVIPVLLGMVTLIQTNTVESYVLNVNTDGENKLGIVEQIFALDLNMSFFNDLLVKYMNSTMDTNKVKNKIVTFLTGKGLKIDPKALIDYICNSTVSADDKITFVKKMLLNGTQLRGDAVNIYLESISTRQFNSELFALIVGSSSNISEKALSKYLLFCKDSDSFKLKNFTSFTKKCHKNATDIRCEAVCCGQKISGNLLPVYVLSSPDSVNVTKEISDFLIGNKAKLNTDISTSGMGTIKLKKFVSANQNDLNPVTSQICTAYKIKH